jgi:phosphopantothenoylcysteine decarboxylase/phosphopantothenate--cysteine ligase
MNCDMWAKAAVQRNVAQLKEDGYHFSGPDKGWLSCGQVGAGRMSEPTTILKTIEALIPTRSRKHD